ncbi:MAG: hypothetical protein ACRD3T_07540 [Terriglobia bacterium]
MGKKSETEGTLRASGALPALLLPLAVVSALLLLAPAAPAKKNAASPVVPDMTGKYHFLSPDDVAAILEEEGKLKGYIDVYQGQDESDAILSYQIAIGTRNGNQVEFKTRKIHEKYYRFTGTVERGKGAKEGDPDYLQLVGELQIATSDSVTGKESVATKQVTLKSIGKNEGVPDE